MNNQGETRNLVIVSFILFSFSWGLSSAQTTSTAGGEWSDDNYWSGTAPPYSNIASNIIINHRITSNQAIVFADGGGNRNTITVNDTLVIYGSLTLGSFDDVSVGANGVLIIFGDFTADNQVDVANGGYFVVLGDFNLPNGGTSYNNQGDGKTFITGDVVLPNNGAEDLECDPDVDVNCGYGDGSDLFDDPIFDFIDEISDETCSITLTATISAESGGGDGAIDVTLSGASNPSYVWDNDEITQDISGLSTGNYSLVVFDGVCVIDTTFTVGAISPCCSGKEYISNDNYTGNWEDVSSWATSLTPLPPPVNPLPTNTLCIDGYITLNSDLTVNGGTQTICDTLVITGSLYAQNPTITIESTGVLIILGDMIMSTGSITNNGRVIFAGELEAPYNLNGTGDYYVFDASPTVPGWFSTPTYDESELESMDFGLYTFYSGLACGGSISGGTISSSQTICANDDVSAFTNTASASSGFTYQWYLSENSSDPATGIWTAITGATSETYDHGTLTQTTYFFRKATKGAGCEANSNVLTITVNTPTTPVISSNDADNTICEGESISLDAGAGYSNYSWSSGGSLQTEIITNSSDLTSTQTETITVTVEDGNGCSATSAPVEINIYPIPITGDPYHIKPQFGN